MMSICAPATAGSVSRAGQAPRQRQVSTLAPRHSSPPSSSRQPLGPAPHAREIPTAPHPANQLRSAARFNRVGSAIPKSLLWPSRSHRLTVLTIDRACASLNALLRSHDGPHSLRAAGRQGDDRTSDVGDEDLAITIGIGRRTFGERLSPAMMRTPTVISLTSTLPSPLQSPGQGA